MRLIQSLASKELVRNLPKLKVDQHFYDACKMGKQAHASHKAKNIVSTTRCLELLHMDLFDPSAVQSYKGNRYTLVIVDDYSRKQISDKRTKNEAKTTKLSTERKEQSKPKSKVKAETETNVKWAHPYPSNGSGPPHTAGNLSLLSFVNHDPTYMVKTLGDHSNPRVQIGEARSFIAKRQDEGNYGFEGL
ncbi:hypothetical protein Tco_0653617 [Tanacetum coccineum]|uniref:Uncharacterized protein n=1 Tax=Tanacetum coccineum TaxID=301880 RepID=A0ABQ4X182_9ASTR